MITAFEIYLLGLVDNIIDLCALVSFLSFLSIVFWATNIEYTNDDDKKERNWKRIKTALMIAIIFAIICTFTPSTKTLVTMTVLPEVVNNEKVQQLPDVFLDYIIEEFTVEEKK